MMAQVEKAEGRESILAAAASLFTEHGYARATINPIANAARMAPSNVYVYFESKLAIMFAIYEPWFRQHLDDLEQEVAALKSPEAKVCRIVQKLWRDIPGDRNAFTFQAISTATPEDRYDPTLHACTGEASNSAEGRGVHVSTNAFTISFSGADSGYVSTPASTVAIVD
jgi:AcrR family transcriptional regulator